MAHEVQPVASCRNLIMDFASLVRVALPISSFGVKASRAPCCAYWRTVGRPVSYGIRNHRQHETVTSGDSKLGGRQMPNDDGNWPCGKALGRVLPNAGHHDGQDTPRRTSDSSGITHPLTYQQQELSTLRCTHVRMALFNEYNQSTIIGEPPFGVLILGADGSSSETNIR